MNAIIEFNAQPLTMSSLEISELVGSRHDKVKQSIERLAERSVISQPPMGEVKVERERRTETVRVYNLVKRDSLVVVAQLCPEFTARIVDRWQELEEQVAKPDPMQVLNDPQAMRGLLLTYTEKVLTLENKVEQLTPKAQALDRIASADGSLCITDAAKNLGVQPKILFAWLQEHKWIYRRPGCSHYCGYQDKIQAGLVEQKITVVSRSDGTEKTVEQARITPKGLAKLSEVVEFRAVA